MARPTTKNDLIQVSNANFEKIWQQIDMLTETELSTEFDFSNQPNKKESHWKRDKNIRDVLVHLYEWHQLLIKFITENRAGNKVSFLPKPYTFKTTSEMNLTFTEKHQQTSYQKAVELLKNSHLETMKLIETFSDEELFTKKYFLWTGTTSLGSYCISSTSSHYDWAIKKIKAHKKVLANS